KMVHGDFRTESRKLLNKRRHIFDQRTRKTLKILLINKSRELFGVACCGKKSRMNNVDWTNLTGYDVRLGYCAANRERSDVESDCGSVAIDWCVVQHRIGDDVCRGGHGGKVTECSGDLLFTELFRPRDRLFYRIKVRRWWVHRKNLVRRIFFHVRPNSFFGLRIAILARGNNRPRNLWTNNC